MHGSTPGALLPGDGHCLGSGSAHATGHASAFWAPSPAAPSRCPARRLDPCCLLSVERARSFFSCCKRCLSREKEKQGVAGNNEMSARPGWSSTVALSCQGPVAQSPVSRLSGLMSVLSVVVHKAGCSQRLEGLSPPRAAGKEPNLGASSVSVARPPASASAAGGEGPWGFPFVVPCVHGASGLARDPRDGSSRIGC